MASPSKQPSMDDILNSIRSTVEEESAKAVGEQAEEGGSPAVEQAAVEPEVGGDILELSAEDMAPVAEKEEELSPVAAGQPEETEEPIDIQKFSEGEGDMPQPETTETPVAEQQETPADAEKIEKKQEDDPEASPELDGDKSDEEVEAELDALLAEVKAEDSKKDVAPAVEKPAEAPVEEENTSMSADDLEALLEGSATEGGNVPEAPVEEDSEANIAGDDIDALLAENSEESSSTDEKIATEVEEALLTDVPEAAAPEAPVEEENVDVDALLEAGTPTEETVSLEVKEEEPAAAEEVAIPEPEPTPKTAPEPTPEVAPEPTPEPAPAPLPEAPKRTVNLAAIPAPTGLQIGFPAEVLAEALRPLVQDWVNDNLPDMVEKLVREELEKLADS